MERTVLETVARRMGQKELVEVLEEIDRLLDESPEMDEANTKAKIVQPLLEALDWTIASDAILEYGFQMGTTNTRIKRVTPFLTQSSGSVSNKELPNRLTGSFSSVSGALYVSHPY